MSNSPEKIDELAKHQASKDFWKSIEDSSTSEKAEIVTDLISLLGSDMAAYPIEIGEDRNIPLLMHDTQALFQEMVAVTKVLSPFGAKPVVNEVLPQALAQIGNIIVIIKQEINAKEREKLELNELSLWLEGKKI
ncbi:MAG: hypothetical protein AAGA67_10805 [Cyanobacteria bacterium P01_F01_bin.153]